MSSLWNTPAPEFELERHYAEEGRSTVAAGAYYLESMDKYIRVQLRCRMRTDLIIVIPAEGKLGGHREVPIHVAR
jgi:hypothetical protein